MSEVELYISGRDIYIMANGRKMQIQWDERHARYAMLHEGAIVYLIDSLIRLGAPQD